VQRALGRTARTEESLSTVRVDDCRLVLFVILVEELMQNKERLMELERRIASELVSKECELPFLVASSPNHWHL
jgi:chemotaxis protein histidine kinase CheA